MNPLKELNRIKVYKKKKSKNIFRNNLINKRKYKPKRFGKNKRIKPISDLCVNCKKKVHNHHYLCECCWRKR